jgi:hypothetical protein
MNDVNCWICGAPAETREHKFKRSDLVRSSATWTPADHPYFFGSGGVRRIRSPNSHAATFGKVLCGNCNSARTQPFDRAYERFSRWVNDAEGGIMTMSHLDFTAIYGSDCQGSVLDLQRYFVKHLGCRLASDRYEIPAGLAQSLWSDLLTPFEISLTRTRVLGDLPARGPGILGNHALFGTYSPSRGTTQGPYLTGVVVGYLDVIIRYAFPDRYPWEGDAVDHRSPNVRLGLYEGPTSGQHLSDGQIPQCVQSRKIQIGEIELDLPVLSPDHLRHILSLERPEPGLTLEQQIERRLEIAYAILAPFVPGLTKEYLEENLSFPETDALWRLVFPTIRGA